MLSRVDVAMSPAARGKGSGSGGCSGYCCLRDCGFCVRFDLAILVPSVVGRALLYHLLGYFFLLLLLLLGLLLRDELHEIRPFPEPFAAMTKMGKTSVKFGSLP